MTPGHRFHVYMPTWHAGAGCRPYDAPTAHDDAAIYDRGYADGKAAGLAAAEAYAQEVGHKILVLKTANDRG